MIIATILLTLLSFKDELSGFIDLYSTLQSNYKVYAINLFITGMLTSMEFYLDVWILDKISLDFVVYFYIALIVNVCTMVFGTIILANKPKLKKWIRNKKISKSMKQKWQEKRETKHVQIQQEVMDQPKTVPPTPTTDNLPDNKKN